MSTTEQDLLERIRKRQMLAQIGERQTALLGPAPDAPSGDRGAMEALTTRPDRRTPTEPADPREQLFPRTEAAPALARVPGRGVAPEPNRSALQEFTRGARAGGRQYQASAGEALEQLGAGDLGRRLSEGARRAMPRARVGRARDIRSMDDFVDWASYSLGQGLVSTAAPVAGGVAGAAVAGPAGAAAGALGPSYALMLGEIRGEMEASGVDPDMVDRIAPLAAVPASALEALLPGSVGRSAIRGTAGRFGRELAKRILARGAGGAVQEGVTEGAQTLVGKGAVQAGGVDVDWGEAVREALDAAAAGSVTGGVLGGGGAVVEGRTQAQPPVEKEAMLERIARAQQRIEGTEQAPAERTPAPTEEPRIPDPGMQNPAPAPGLARMSPEELRAGLGRATTDAEREAIQARLALVERGREAARRTAAEEARRAAEGPPPVTATGAEGLGNLGEMGAAISENMREMLWERAQRGETTEAGGPSNVLLVAKAIRDRGGLQTREEFDAYLDDYGRNRPTDAAGANALVGRWAARAAGDVSAPPGAHAALWVTPDEIDVDPERFQYKESINPSGETGALKDVRKWDENRAGVVMLWRDPEDGRRKVVNGHQRVALARRLGAPRLRAIEIEAESAEDARVQGALVNIGEGSGTAVDAAKVLRETGMSAEDLRGQGVPLAGAVARDGLALANLHEGLFSLVARGRIPIARAAVIGKSRLAPEQQMALWQLVQNQEGKKRLTNAEVEELARFVAGAGSEQATQETLFGTETVDESLALDKARLSAWVKQQLRRQANLFRFVARGERARQIEQAGVGQIDTEAAGSLGTEAAQVSEVYERLSGSAGPVSEALNRAVREIRAGGSERDVRTGLLDQVKAAVQEVVGGREGPDPAAGEAPPRVQSGGGATPGRRGVPGRPDDLLDVDLFGEETGEVTQGGLDLGGRGPQGMTAALEEARAVVSALEGRIARGAASDQERIRYEQARSLIRRAEGRGLDAGEVRARRDPSAAAGPDDNRELFDVAPGISVRRGGTRRSPTSRGTATAPPTWTPEDAIPAEVTVDGEQRTLRPIAPVELVRLTGELGARIFVRRFPKARGVFRPDPKNPQIGLHPDLGKDYDQAVRTLAHEIGHLVDFLGDEKTMARGNILGRIASLRKHLAETIAALPSARTRSLTPNDRRRIRREAEKAVGPRPSADDVGGLDSWRAQVRQRYAERILEEMEAKNMLGRERVHEELLLLSEWWRPFNRKGAPRSLIEYRESSHELYADALSVLLNTPGTLQARAPQFFDAWLAYLERKPSVKKVYFEIQDLLGRGEADVYAARRAELEADFARGEEIQRTAEGRTDPQSFVSYLKQLLVSRSAPATDAERRRLRAEGKSVPAHSADHAVKMALQEFQHGDNVNRVMLMDVDRLVQRPLLEAGLNQDQAGAYLMLHRIAEGDRGGMAEQAKEAIKELTGEKSWPAARAAYIAAREKSPEEAAESEGFEFDPALLELASTGVLNPHGYTPAEARRQLDGMKAELGPKAYQVLQESMDQLREILFRSVEEAVRVGSYNRRIFENQMLPNRRTYAPFAVLHYFSGRMSAGVRRQVGTVSGIANPYTAAIMKAMTLNRLNEHQKAKLAIVDVLKRDFPGQGEEHRVDKFRREKRPGPGKRNLTYLIDGKLHYREVDEYIVRMLDSSDLGSTERLVKTLSSRTYGLFHPLYVSWSLAWQARNVTRDWKRTYKNLAAAHAGKPTYRQAVESVLDLGHLFMAYYGAAAPAWRHARRQQDQVVREMLEDRALGRAFHSFEPVETDLTHERLLQRYGILKPEAKGFRKAARAVGHPIEIMGVFQETWGKAAAWKLLGDQGVTGRERAYIVRNYTGTPDSSDRGLASDATNALFLYANVVSAGLRADAEVALQPSTAAGYWLRSVMIDFAPKMIMAAALAGWLGDELKEWMERIPSYDQEKYLVVPVPPFWATNERGERKAIYLRVPHDDANRILAASTWALLVGNRPWAPSHAIGIVAGEFPGLSPAIDIPLKWGKALAGENPYDAWLGRPIVPRTEWEAGGWPRQKEMIRWTLGQWGIVSQVLGRWTYGAPQQPGEKATGEDLLRTIPGLSALIKISDRGLDEERWWELEREAQQRARLRSDLATSVRRAVSERSRLNRFGEDRLDASERRRRRTLNAWYRRRYLPLTARMEAARERDNDQVYDEAADRLESSVP